MKTIKKHKAFAFWGAAFMLLIAVFAGCKQPASSSGGGTPTPPAVKKFKVTLENIGGNVTVTPALPSECMVAEGTLLTFTATPLSGYKFAKWELNGTDTGVTKPVYKLTVTKASKVKAVFKEDNPAIITKHRVTITPPANGNVTTVPQLPDPYSNNVPKGTEITFTAKPAAGYTVDTWNISGGQILSGGTEGSSTAKVKITADTTVKVKFKILVLKHLVTMSAGAHGSINAAPALPSDNMVDEGTSITFTAKPASGYKVDTWDISGGQLLSGGTEGSSTATVKITGNTTVKVKFKILALKHLVKMNAGAHGSISAAPALPQNNMVDDGTSITFTATALSGYKVNTWDISGGQLLSGGIAGSSTAKIKITGNTTVKVFFIPDGMPITMHWVTLTPPANGNDVTTVPQLPDPYSNNVPKGTEITFTAKPASGYKVDTWTITGGQILSGGTEGSSTAKVKITADTNIKVKFKMLPPKYLVTMSAGAHGSISAAPALPSDNMVDDGTSITFTAKPDAGYKVDTWTITKGQILSGGTEGSSTAKVKITGNTTVKVKFKIQPPKHLVTMSAEAHGSINAAPALPSDNMVDEGTSITFTAKPVTGYTVDTWNISGGQILSGGTEGSSTATVKITGNTTVKVKFKPAAYPVSFGVDGGHGTLKATVDGSEINSDNTVEHGKTVTFTAVPENAEYNVEKWTITGGVFETGTGMDGSSTATVKITAATTVNVKFKSIYTVVAFAELDTYLKTKASDTNINYIKVIGLTSENLRGVFSSIKPSPLGKILNDNPTKKVALKFGGNIENLTYMDCCFAGCKSLTQAPVIPASVKDMYYCFIGCTSLTQAPAIPASVTDMNSCFSGCKSLTEAPAIPASVKQMGTCFAGCTSLTEAPAIPASVTYMEGCFAGCKSLTQAPVIPASVKNIGYCFRDCTNLTQAPVIPSSIENMYSCFKGCTSLTQAPVIPASVDNMKSCFAGCTSLTEAPAIPASVKDMEGCFENCTNLTQAPVIPSSVENMYSCFKGCTSLTQAPAIPASVRDMKECFRDCTSLTQAATIPDGVTNMYCCFLGCTNLTEAPFIPASVKDISYCFEGCTSLTQAAAISNGVTNMYSCFLGCTNLTEAPFIPASVKDISYCFEGCTSLTQAPRISYYSVKDMKGCFKGCTNLTKVPFIPISVKDISYCFEGCTSLTQVPDIPVSVKDMSSCFAHCTSLTEAPVIPASVTDMSSCFAHCTSLTKAPAIPASVTDMSSCFAHCTSLTKAPAIPASVTDMGACFYNCDSLTSVRLKCNYKVGSWFNDAFKSCTSLPAGGIKVPYGQLSAYQAAAGNMGTTADRFAGE